MPIYEYDCCACGHRFETLVRRGDEPTACPECGAEDLQRAWSVFSSKQGGAGAVGEAPCGAPAPT